VPGCDTNGYDTTEPTINGGRFPFKLGDSLACKAWKLAATVCSTPPLSYNSDTNSTGDRSWNFQCRSGGFAAFDRVSASSFGDFCFVADQYICTGCPGACNAQCSFAGSNPLMTMRGCNGGEAIYNPDLAQIFQTAAPVAATYMMNAAGTNVCPPGSSKITDDAGCVAAARASQRPYAGSTNDPNLPGGCSARYSAGAYLHIYFNNNTGGAHPDYLPLCLGVAGSAVPTPAPAPTTMAPAATYDANELDTNVCRVGYSKITTDAGCEAAAASLGYSYYGNWTYPAYPSGCFIEPTGARLNLDPIGAGYGALRPLCRISGSNLRYDEYSQRVAALEAEVAQLRATVHSQAAELEYYRNRTRA